MRFDLGTTFATPAAFEAVGAAFILIALARHSEGDWGDVGDDDRAANELALQEGGRLLSVYRHNNGRKLWVITEADRASTTALLPEEY